MSYDVYLRDPVTNEVLELDAPHHMRGGTFALGGETRAHLNITWNYARHFYRLIGTKGIRTIYGMTGAASIPLLKAAAEQLGDDADPNYWAPTEGNAKRALLQMIALAEMRPDGVWSGD